MGKLEAALGKGALGGGAVLSVWPLEGLGLSSRLLILPPEASTEVSDQDLGSPLLPHFWQYSCLCEWLPLVMCSIQPVQQCMVVPCV